MNIKKTVTTKVLAYGIVAHGLLMLAANLGRELGVGGGHTVRIKVLQLVFSIPIILALTLLYVGVYIRRRKRTAWLTAIVLYSLLMAVALVQLNLLYLRGHLVSIESLLPNIVLPLTIIGGLVWYRDEFTVRSDLRSFAVSLRFIGLLLVVTFAYGIVGFILLDTQDFHRDITPLQAAHYTVDQFGLTTEDLVAYTHRAHIFLDSLSLVSVAALCYSLIALFQPIRARFSDHTIGRTLAEQLLKQHPATSEDYFKLWPRDKMYLFTSDFSAGIAYVVHRGVALSAGEPFGNPRKFTKLLYDFDEMCFTNDWLPAFVHTLPELNELFVKNNYAIQKIGEEAVIDLAQFHAKVRRSKYFRQIDNKFTRAGYTTEFCKPPHSEILLAELARINREWLKRPGREERGFLMGYFTPDYLQQCALLVARDAKGKTVGFLNQVPSFDPLEANYDLLRYGKVAPSNTSDFLLLKFCDYLVSQTSMERLNLGLCPLAGMSESSKERSVIDNALWFLYANGDRLYSFSGLYRFKAKYQPQWSNRYIAYRGGVAGFTRTVAALRRAMKI